MTPDSPHRATPLRLTLSDWYLCAPLLLLIFGPPVWRSFGSRSISATTSGQLDVAILWQLGIYFLAGSLATIRLISWRKELSITNNGQYQILLSVSVILLMSASAFVAPSLLTTIVFSALFAIGLVIAAQTIAALNFGLINLPILFECVNRLLLLLLVLVFISFILDPGTVSVHSQGMFRLKGNQVAPASLCGVLLLIWALNRYAYERQLLIPAIIILTALLAISLAELRTGEVLALGIFFYYFAATSSKRSKALKARSLMPQMVLFGLPVLFITIGIFGNELYENFTRGNLEQARSISGRTLIWDWIVERLEGEWLGLGFVSGFRIEFQSLGGDLVWAYRQQGLITSVIGNAHSAYFELIAGLGWIFGLFCLIVIFGPLAITTFRCIGRPILGIPDSCRHQYILTAATILAISLVDSSPVLPPGTEFGLLILSFSVSQHFATRMREQNLSAKSHLEPEHQH